MDGGQMISGRAITLRKRWNRLPKRGSWAEETRLLHAQHKISDAMFLELARTHPNLDEFVEMADGLMVTARGLGILLGLRP